jgi:hypothetical protein
MSPKVEEVCNLLADMQVEDRLGVLLFAIVEADPAALAVSLRMLNATVALSARLSATNRFKISTALRDAADTLERPLVVAPVP